jgi:CRISPR-associated endonuclease Cas3-HD
MMEYLAHSKKGEYAAQSYKEHIGNVYSHGIQYAREAETYAKMGTGLLSDAVGCAAIWHDFGKLDEENQDTLHGENTAAHLPVNHVDAGAAVLVQREQIYPALAVYSHHKGLPDMRGEETRGSSIFRDERPAIRKKVDSSLDKLMKIHRQEISLIESYNESYYEGDQGVFFRMMLSCLSDADHMDTAITYGQAPEHEVFPALRAKDRLALLDKYVAGLGSDDERSRLRREMYFDCRDSVQAGGFAVCDSPVGSGKTTAVMAHLLRQADIRGARHIFVILPYTSIITQSVEIYRRALVFPEEKSEEVVAELHCRADFQDKDIRYLTSLWRAPIIVTTAVAFFETLSSSRPSALRRLHELPGSVIFVDEVHGALPISLLPLAWHWMNVLANEWSCYWTLASGSLVRFWQLPSLVKLEMEHPEIPDLVSAPLRSQLMQYETDRISFRFQDKPMSREELIQWVQNMPGPRLLIMNTVQSAAVIADDIRHLYGREKVEHLSTALDAADRSLEIERVKKRLADKADDDWTLVATSCVEAGVDFSFRTGFREISSLLSLLQAAGRVNRHGNILNAEMWSFTMQDDPMLKENRDLETSKTVLCDYFRKSVAITPELSTRSMNDQINRNDTCLKVMKHLLDEENDMQFKTVESEFQVIDSDTVTVVVDEALAQNICFGGGDWKQLQQYAVSVRRDKIQKWRLKAIAENIYQWTLSYDSFLGYMAGVIELERTKDGILIM